MPKPKVALKKGFKKFDELFIQRIVDQANLEKSSFIELEKFSFRQHGKEIVVYKVDSLNIDEIENGMPFAEGIPEAEEVFAEKEAGPEIEFIHRVIRKAVSSALTGVF